MTATARRGPGSPVPESLCPSGVRDLVSPRGRVVPRGTPSGGTPLLPAAEFWVTWRTWLVAFPLAPTWGHRFCADSCLPTFACFRK